MNKKTNRLINETSPYLLQHAYNPVDWYPWGSEAFEKAVAQNRLIFLSIGYSSCHWCHKMAHDTFEDEKTAQYLNDNYVSIKIDREERPDIDDIYMMSCQILSGSCGWPLNIIMTPDKKPIFSGTYLPAKDSFGKCSLLTLLKEVNELWLNDKKKIAEIGNTVLTQLDILQKEPIKEEISIITLEKAFDAYIKIFDKEYGGFGTAPKFPMPHYLNFLIQWYKKSNRTLALEMVEKTLNSIYKGGIFDHVNGGFHRYSIDSKWLIPHFEKMLYDQALIAKVYIEAYQVTENRLYANVARKTLDFVLEELISKEGAFYSGLDADSEGEEGKFYTWTKEELTKILGANAEIFCEFYGVIEKGNFDSGKNVLYISNSIENLCEKHKLNVDEVKEMLDKCLKKLKEVKNQRTHPNSDDKIITSWNGLMIKSFAFAAKALKEEKYKTAAVRAGEFVIENLISAKGNIFRSYSKNKLNILGFLEDYSFVIYGFLELYDLTSDAKFFEISKKLSKIMVSEFYDTKTGGFYSSSINSETPLTRIKSPVDNTLPSGNSIAVLDLLILGKMAKNKNYINLAHNTFSYFGYSVNQFPTGFSELLSAYLYSIG